MNIEQTKIKKIKLTELDRLDPITVFIEDYEAGKGKITFECFGKSWSYFWGGMGSKNIAEFFLSCNTAYLVNCLWDHSMPSSEPDFDGIQLSIQKWVVEQRREHLMGRDCARAIYDINDWESYAPQHTYDTWSCPTFLDECYFNEIHFLDEQEIPEKSTSEYCYLARIVEAISEAFGQLKQEESA